MKHLSRLTNLRMLSFIGTQVGDAGLKHLAGMQSLTTLYLADTNVTGRDLSALVKLTALQKLSLGGDKFDPKSADLTSLQKLKLLKQRWVSPGTLTKPELDRWTKELPGVRIIDKNVDEDETELISGNGQKPKTPIESAIHSIRQKLIDHVNAGKAGSPPDQKKIDPLFPRLFGRQIHHFSDSLNTRILQVLECVRPAVASPRRRPAIACSIDPPRTGTKPRRRFYFRRPIPPCALAVHLN